MRNDTHRRARGGAGVCALHHALAAMRCWFPLLACLGAASGACAGDLIEAQASTLRLRSAVVISGAIPTLADVLDFSDADPRLAEEIGPRPVAAKAEGAASARQISHAAIAERLGSLGVNLARVNLSGALHCSVSVAPPDRGAPASAEAQAPEARAGAPLLRKPAGEQTLEAALRERINADLAALGGSAEIEFETAAGEFLELRSADLDFGIVGRRDASLGFREYFVTLRRDGKVQQRIRIGAQIKLIRKVLTAAKPLNIGAYIRRDSLELVERVFSDAREVGLAQVDEVVGQQVRKFIAPGEMLTRADLKAVDMVQSSRPVTVVSDGPVSMRISGIARDSGHYGDSVRVWLGDGKQRREVRGTVSGLGIVTLSEEIR